MYLVIFKNSFVMTAAQSFFDILNVCGPKTGTISHFNTFMLVIFIIKYWWWHMIEAIGREWPCLEYKVNLCEYISTVKLNNRREAHISLMKRKVCFFYRSARQRGWQIWRSIPFWWIFTEDDPILDTSDRYINIEHF